MCPGPNGEPRLSTYALRRTRIRQHLAAATTACTILCTVLGGALISGHPSAPEPAPAPRAAAPADALPDRLAELAGVERAIPAPSAPPAAPAPAVTESAVSPGRGGGVNRASRSATRGQRADRPPKAPSTKSRPPVTGKRRSAAPAPLVPAYADGDVVGFALAQVGKHYAFGSSGPDEYDCSGLVSAAYRLMGISLPHSTGGLAHLGRPVGRDELRPGDLVFPTSGHVGIYIGNGRMVHASTQRGGVKISGVYAFSFARRIVG
ncbi:C40 family peptidase [Dactylosporangium sp. NPDC051485]|uniref:C40 family peptidase n=1 Tax=Dactylosporangium sp. NPDC051485 TaxID=3154846 RepID=UPI00342B718F